MNPINPPFGDPRAPVGVPHSDAWWERPPLTVKQAQKANVCRFCQIDNAPHGPDNPFLLHYGSEYAHKKCVDKANEVGAALPLPVEDDLSGASNAPDWTSLSRDDLVLMASRLQAECAELDRLTRMWHSKCQRYESLLPRLCAALASTTPYLKRLAVEHNPFAADTLAAVQDALDATDFQRP